ncbi:hypothetical protein [Halomonas rhizosphaerae]|uniref:Secreted protein n=1 Tax=Halomonas rhizosphaerae TaxID=3043296 RepID=A0ABT6UZJ4_9GAMM|nr:hypothetical protein [Halomonas rhizosphaerae]MDI5891101.1 hypothetical protein [Halomonas rhizosphaerae]
MLHRLRHRLGYLFLLLLFLPGLVLTSAGEARAHGPLSAEAHQEAKADRHGHAHGHDHMDDRDDRDQGDGRHLHHESGNHFHETADRLAAGVSLAPRFRDALRIGARHGVPLRRVYRLERPPRPVIAG